MQLEISECYDDLNDALKGAIKALGGFKAVGQLLWPEIEKAETAAQKLRDCVNADRRERLTPEQFVMILRLARDKNFHASMDYVAQQIGYKATPVNPADVDAELQRNFIDAVAQLAEMGNRLMQRQQPARVRAVG